MVECVADAEYGAFSPVGYGVVAPWHRVNSTV